MSVHNSRKYLISYGAPPALLVLLNNTTLWQDNEFIKLAPPQKMVVPEACSANIATTHPRFQAVANNESG